MGLTISKPNVYRDWNESSYGLSNGILGINCRHSAGFFVPGKSTFNPVKYDESANAERYKQEQKQRRYERELRKTKRARNIARDLGDEDETRRLNQKARLQSQRLREHIAEHDLRRSKVRERPMDKPVVVTIASNNQIEARNPADGTGAGIYTGYAKLTKRQQKLDAMLPESGKRITINKRDIKMKDLSALTAKNGCEYAVFTKGGQRILARGSSTNAMVSTEYLENLAKDGWRFSGHTHPGVGHVVRMSSQGDKNVLKLFKQKQSVIYDSVGGFDVFDSEGGNHENR
ncbi:MAG TPA: hypothetical protein GXZ43_01340 [Clostridiaceae bacterium]|nr:hypothetical protein [Clostridiaceae bacterium]